MPATAYGHMHLHTYVRCKGSMSTLVLRYVLCGCLSLVAIVCYACIPSLSSPLQVVPLQPTRNCCLGLGDIHGPVHSPAHLEESVKSSPPT